MNRKTALSMPADHHFSAIRPGHYVIDPVHTRVLFGASHFGFSTFFGEFTSASGMLYIDPLRLDVTRLDVSVPVANVYTTSKLLDEELASAEWLDSARHPILALTSTSVLPQSDRLLDLVGNLSMHGVTRPVSLDVTFHGAGINPVKDVYSIGFDVRGRILRSDFGVTSHLPLIGDELELIISASFELCGTTSDALAVDGAGETT